MFARIRILAFAISVSIKLFLRLDLIREMIFRRRFGIWETKKAEELKRKARADRFGVVASAAATDQTEEEAKKKAKLARFGKAQSEVVEEEDEEANSSGFGFLNLDLGFVFGASPSSLSKAAALFLPLLEAFLFFFFSISLPELAAPEGVASAAPVSSD